MTKPETNPTLKLRVSQKAESILRSGHPWLFSDSIREQNRTCEAGDLAVIYDRKDQFLGMGLFDPEGPIRVRMLHVGKPQKLDRAWWQQHLTETLDRRRNLFDSETNGYRLCNGENDGWPGLVLDRYDSTLVLKIYTTAWIPRLEEVVEIIAEQVPCERIILRLTGIFRTSRLRTPKARSFAESPCSNRSLSWSLGFVSKSMSSVDRRRVSFSINVTTVASSNHCPMVARC